ncbi:MAG: GNAT family N-acetyltransferase [Candidatus Binatia bacterium]
MKARIRRATLTEDRKKAFSIRLRVFVKEQGVPREIELDSDDAHAIHLLACANGRAVGTARVVLKRKAAKIGRMAVLKTYRGRGVGRELLKRAVKAARQKGAKRIYLHAQVPVIVFYEKLGFRCAGRVFLEAAIPHRKMVLETRE